MERMLITIDSESTRHARPRLRTGMVGGHGVVKCGPSWRRHPGVSTTSGSRGSTARDQAGAAVTDSGYFGVTCRRRRCFSDPGLYVTRPKMKSSPLHHRLTAPGLIRRVLTLLTVLAPKPHRHRLIISSPWI